MQSNSGSCCLQPTEKTQPYVANRQVAQVARYFYGNHQTKKPSPMTVNSDVFCIKLEALLRLRHFSILKKLTIHFQYLLKICQYYILNAKFTWQPFSHINGRSDNKLLGVDKVVPIILLCIRRSGKYALANNSRRVLN